MAAIRMLFSWLTEKGVLAMNPAWKSRPRDFPFRATGITNFLENDGTLEAAQCIAGHADSRTTNQESGNKWYTYYHILSLLTFYSCR